MSGNLCAGKLVQFWLLHVHITDRQTLSTVTVAADDCCIRSSKAFYSLFAGNTTGLRSYSLLTTDILFSRLEFLAASCHATVPLACAATGATVRRCGGAYAAGRAVCGRARPAGVGAGGARYGQSRGLIAGFNSSLVSDLSDAVGLPVTSVSLTSFVAVVSHTAHR